MEDYVEIYWKAWRSRYAIDADCPKSATSSHTVCPRKDSAPSRGMSPENFRRATQAKKGRRRDAKAIPNNSRDKPCETKPTDEKARESGQIACNRNAATAFPLSPSRCLSLSLSPSVSRDVAAAAVSAVADLSLPATWRSTARDARNKRSAFPSFFFFFLFFIVFLLSSEIVSAARRRAPRWIG